MFVYVIGQFFIRIIINGYMLAFVWQVRDTTCLAPFILRTMYIGIFYITYILFTVIEIYIYIILLILDFIHSSYRNSCFAISLFIYGLG